MDKAVGDVKKCQQDHDHGGEKGRTTIGEERQRREIYAQLPRVAEIDRRSQNPDNIYFLQGEGGFTSIADDQLFYLDAGGSPVVVFEKYEIAPGYMGVQEFTIPLPEGQDQAQQNT